MGSFFGGGGGGVNRWGRGRGYMWLGRLEDRAPNISIDEGAQ